MGAECTKVEELCHGEHKVSFVADTLCPLWLMLVFLSESTK
jgi:hypothetical protein